jgi:multiple sugar transport system substrate-binding protein
MGRRSCASREQPARVVLPLAPADAISSFLTLCANAGSPPASSEEQFADPTIAAYALEMLRELYALGPESALKLNPPSILDAMTESDDIVYVPLLYGYTNYSRPGARQRPCRFLDIPSAGAGPIGATLGGAGLAVAATSERQAEAASFAAWFAQADVQRTLVFPAGGQPASASAWRDAEIDTLSGHFTGGTARTIQAAYVRPRHPWWPAFQLAAGELINGFLGRGGPLSATIARLEGLYAARSLEAQRRPIPR